MAHSELEASLRDKAVRLGALNEGIQVLHVEIDEKIVHKEELARVYEDKKREVDSAEKEVTNEILTLNKEIDTEAILYRRDLLYIKQELNEATQKYDKMSQKIQKLTIEKER